MADPSPCSHHHPEELYLMPEIMQNFLWNFATWLVLGVYGGLATGQIFDLEYLGLLSSAWPEMSSNPYQ